MGEISVMAILLSANFPKRRAQIKDSSASNFLKTLRTPTLNLKDVEKICREKMPQSQEKSSASSVQVSDFFQGADAQAERRSLPS